MARGTGGKKQDFHITPAEQISEQYRTNLARHLAELSRQMSLMIIQPSSLLRIVAIEETGELDETKEKMRWCKSALSS